MFAVPIALIFAAGLALTIATAACPAELDGPLIGRAHVIDGDTLDLVDGAARVRIRLNAIDAPESRQTCRSEAWEPFQCGAEASATLRQMIEGRELRCDPLYLDRYRRTVATCFLGTVDIGRAMVRAGEAIAFRKYGLQYVPDEDQARAAHRGLWRGEFTMPADWRREHRVP
jgi:endonuclease YncB( thermonuclease family)